MDGDYEGLWHKDGVPAHNPYPAEKALEVMVEDWTRLHDEMHRFRAALEQIRALQPHAPFWDSLDLEAWGRWQAAQIADAALRGQGKEGE